MKHYMGIYPDLSQPSICTFSFKSSGALPKGKTIFEMSFDTLSKPASEQLAMTWIFDKLNSVDLEVVSLYQNQCKRSYASIKKSVTAMAIKSAVETVTHQVDHVMLVPEHEAKVAATGFPDVGKMRMLASTFAKYPNHGWDLDSHGDPLQSEYGKAYSYWAIKVFLTKEGII